jgi:acyl-CoA synthetase (NDP forming)
VTVAVVTNAGGAGVLAAGACADADLTLAEFAPDATTRLRALPAADGVLRKSGGHDGGGPL